MRTKLFFAFFALLTFQINAQTIEEKIETLLEIDGTIGRLQQLISETIDFQEDNHFEISDTYWESLRNRVHEKFSKELLEIIIPIYTQTYTASEIDNIIKLFSSDTGKLITEKQPGIIEKLSLGIMQWSQNVNAYIISEIENRGKNESSAEETEKFNEEFKAKYGLQILNLTDLAIDKENNIGNLLVDFGKTNGDEDLTKIIRVKNNSDEEITFEKSPFFSGEAVTFDLGNTPLQSGETRDLKIILIADQAENRNYSLASITSSNGGNISFGVKYDAPTKKISFEISDIKLKFKKLKQGFSKPYVFIVKNTGNKDFYISNIETDQDIAYLSYSKDILKPNQETEIRVIISKKLIDTQTVSDKKLIVQVDLTKGPKNKYSNFPQETIELIIE